MKRFLIKVLFAAGFALFVAVSVVVMRIVLAQKDVRAAFDIPFGTEVVFIGNSHTGCSFAEAPEFRNRKVWMHSMGFSFHYIRLLELERCGMLDRGVKACVVDCDIPSLDYFRDLGIVENLLTSVPFAWRYLGMLPISAFESFREILVHASSSFSFSGEPALPRVDNIVWTELSDKRQNDAFEHIYGASWQTPADWDSEAFPRGWQTRFFEMVADMKARCDRHGVRLIFLATPLASNDPGRANAVVSNRVSAVAEKIRSMGIEYYDCRAACPDNKFRDAGHLLHSSAYEFTKKFYAEVLKLPVGE